jgi:hypothetical protein
MFNHKDVLPFSMKPARCNLVILIKKIYPRLHPYIPRVAAYKETKTAVKEKKSET